MAMSTSRGSSVTNGSAGGRTGHYASDASSSAGSSPSRGRRRRRASESSSAGGFSSQDISEAEEDQEEEDAWQNSILADAILKRPESLRMTSSRGSLRSDGRLSALGSVSSIKEGASRGPSRMSGRSDPSASGGSYGMGLSLGTEEDERYGATAENNSTALGVAETGGEGASNVDAPTQDISSWDSSILAKVVQ